MSALQFFQHLHTALPILIAVIAVVAANKRRPVRHQQFFMPVVAIVVAAIALLAVTQIGNLVDDLVSWVIDLVPFLGNWYRASWMYNIFNVVVLAVFLIAKVAFLRLATKLCVGEEFFGSGLVKHVYEFDVPSGRWYLQHQFGHLRTFMRVLFWTAVAGTLIYTILLYIYPGWPGFATLAYPVFAALVIGELCAVLGGQTREDVADELVGEGDDAHRITNYSGLRRIYQELFGERIMDDGVDLSRRGRVSSLPLLRELASSEDGLDQLHAEFFSRMKERGEHVDENLVQATLGLARGTSTVINTPFFNDLTPYLGFAVYLNVLQNGRCLIIAGRDSSAEDLVEWITEALETITGVPALWSIGIVSENAPDDLEIGVLRFADVHNLHLLQTSETFLNEVSMVVLVEPSRMLATGQLGLGIVMSRCGAGNAPVCVAFDRNHDGLVDALSHLLKVSLTDVVATQLTAGASSEVVWAAEGEPLTRTVLPTIARHLGMGTEIASVALKYHVSQVQWVGGDRFPVIDMAWISEQYYGRITEFAELEPSQRALGAAMIPRHNPLAIKQEDHNFLVVEDEINNAYETIRMYATRATNAGFVNVISEDYLLRDYMVDNRGLFASDPKAVPAFVPDFVRSERNVLFRLLLTLSAFEVSEADVRRELEHGGVHIPDADPAQSVLDEAPVIVKLRELIAEHLGVHEALIHRHLRMSKNENSAVAEEEAVYRLQPTGALATKLASFAPAYFVVEDDTEGANFIGSCLRGHVAQSVLPGQFLTYAGKYYEVISLGGGERDDEVVLRRAAEHITGRPAYRQLRSFALSSTRRDDATVLTTENGGIEVSVRTANVVAQSHGYLELPDRSSLNEAHRYGITGLPAREYRNAPVLRIKLKGVTPDVRQTLTVLLNELFPTLFPLGHNFLVAATADPEGRFSDLLPAFTHDDDEDVIYIVEDSEIDLGLVVAVERNWRRIFETMTDYLRWNASPRVEAEDHATEVTSFPGDTPESLAERARRIAEAEERGEYLVHKPSLWRRFADWLKGLFTPREKPAKPEEVPAEVAAPEAEILSDAGSAQPQEEPAAEQKVEPLADVVHEAELETVEEELAQASVVADPEFSFVFEHEGEVTDPPEESQPVLEPEPEPDPEPDPDPDPDPEPEPNPEPEPDSEPDPEPEVAVDPEPEPEQPDDEHPGGRHA